MTEEIWTDDLDGPEEQPRRRPANNQPQTPILASTVLVARDKGGALGTKGGEDIVEIIATCISLRKLARLDIVDYSHSACLFILVLF